MVANYYYFASSLPSIYMDKDAPISYKDFMIAAKNQIKEKDYHDLELVTFHPEGNGGARLPIVKEWESLIYSVNEMMTEERAKKLGLDSEKEYKARCDHDNVLEDKVKRIVSMDNPLEAERAILSLYFDFLSDYELSDPFSTTALMVYGLKLQIKERASSFDSRKGRAEFDHLFKDVQKDIFHKE